VPFRSIDEPECEPQSTFKTPIMITKTDAAERQLNTAIRLFFEDRDHLSSYALAVASREVSDDVIKNCYSELYQRELARVGDPLKVRLSYREEMSDRIKPEFYKDFQRLDRKWQNFLKHADKDPDAEIEPFATKLLALVILTAIWNYTLLTQHWTIEMQTFSVWIAVAEPQLIKSEHDDLLFNKAITEMRGYISGDPYDRDTLKNICAAITSV
jgi:hypothetical protein